MRIAAVLGLSALGTLVSACAVDHPPSPERSKLGEVSPWPGGTASCPGTSGARATPELEREARSLWQRARFDGRDAPRAVLRLQTALQCARDAGDLQAIDRLGTELEAWTRQVERRLDGARLRLELSLRAGDLEAAGTHARRVGALLAEADAEAAHRARAWLKTLERRARAARIRALEEEQ